jgi:hypothetical protein
VCRSFSAVKMHLSHLLTYLHFLLLMEAVKLGPPTLGHGSAKSLPQTAPAQTSASCLAFNAIAFEVGDMCSRKHNLNIRNNCFGCRATPSRWGLDVRRHGYAPKEGAPSFGRGGYLLSLAKSDDSISDHRRKKKRVKQKYKIAPLSNDPQEVMKRWSSMIKSGHDSADDIKMKTIKALDNLFSGGFMQEGKVLDRYESSPV